MSAIFVTATGTDIGKTFVTCGLIRALQARGRKVAALKPIASGFAPAGAEVSDSGLLLSALVRPVTPETIAEVSPWRFAAPLSPDLAAAREGRVIDFAAVAGFCRDAIATRDGALLIEGVGGVMSPLDARHTVLDWMAALDIPLVLVAGSYLGTISHTLTALDVLRRRGLDVASLVVSESAISTVPLDETRDAVARFAPGLDVVALPRLAGPAFEHPAFDRIAERM
jgi:dethiobiotin synthetase